MIQNANNKPPDGYAVPVGPSAGDTGAMAAVTVVGRIGAANAEARKPPRNKARGILILNRDAGEVIACFVPGREQPILIAPMNGNNVRIGIRADSDVQIMRAEIAKSKFGKNVELSL